MDVAQALSELTELSSQIDRAVVIGADGSVLGSTMDDSAAAEGLARAALDLGARAIQLRSAPAGGRRGRRRVAGGLARGPRGAAGARGSVVRGRLLSRARAGLSRVRASR